MAVTGRFGRWCLRVGGPLLAFVVAVGLVARSSAWTDHRRAIWGFIALLVVIGWWLSHVMASERRGTAERPGPWWWRMVLTAALLGAGLALLLVGGAPSGAFFLGIALVATAFAWVVSELRHFRAWRPGIAAGLLGAALLALAAGTFVPAGAALITAVALGLLLAEVGAEVLSEHVTRPDDPTIRVTWSWVGIGAVACGGLWFVVGFDLNPWHLLILLVALVLLVAMAVADHDSLLIVGLVALGLLWASAPRDVAMDDRQEAVAGEGYMLVLGDSYISGEGATGYVPGTNTHTPNADHTNQCRRAPTAWPVLLARSPPEGLPSRLLFHACSGAVTENIAVEPRLSTSGTQRGPAELALFERDRERRRLGDPELVVISVGGNDAGFGVIGKTCVGPGSCAAVGQQFVDDGTPGPTPEPEPLPGEPPVPDEEEDLASIGDDLDQAYGNIRRSLDDESVPVVVVPYPIPLTEEGACRDLLLDGPERGFLIRFITALNRMVEATAARHGFLYMDTMQDALIDRRNRLCDGIDARAGLNFLALNPTAGDQKDTLLPTNWIHNSFHPNAEGHAAMRDAAVRWFARHSSLTAEAAEAAEAVAATDVDDPTPSRSVEPPTLASLYGSAPPPDQCDPADDADCELDGWQWTYARAAHGYRLVVLPVGLLVVGLWMLLAAARWWLGGQGVNVVGVAGRLWSRFLPGAPPAPRPRPAPGPGPAPGRSPDA